MSLCIQLSQKRRDFLCIQALLVGKRLNKLLFHWMHYSLIAQKFFWLFKIFTLCCKNILLKWILIPALELLEWQWLWWHLRLRREVQNTDEAAPGQDADDTSRVSFTSEKYYFCVVLHPYKRAFHNSWVKSAEKLHHARNLYKIHQEAVSTTIINFLSSTERWWIEFLKPKPCHKAM